MIQRESVQVLESYCDGDCWREDADFPGAPARFLARELDQQSIACTPERLHTLVTTLRRTAMD